MIVIVIMMIIIIANDISRFRLLLPPKIFVSAELALSLSLSLSLALSISLSLFLSSLSFSPSLSLVEDVRSGFSLCLRRFSRGRRRRVQIHTCR